MEGNAAQSGAHRLRHCRHSVRGVFDLPQQLPEHRQYPVADPERVHPRHPRDRHGAGDHRARHRPVDRGDHGDVGGVVPRPDRPGRRRAAGAADRAGDGRDYRLPQRLADRLCRDPRDLRHAGDGHRGLRLRPVLPGADRHHLSLRVGRMAEADRRRQRLRHSEPGHRLRARCASSPGCCCATPSPAATSTPWATTRWPPASPASRRAR